MSADSEPSIYWHDYETWGANPAIDRPSQFAGIRTNLELDVISDPDMWYCKPTGDAIPHPRAIQVTGITPDEAEKNGLPEPLFIRKIHNRLATPLTCGAGYNSLRFDDEVTRYTLYRNFFDPYAREWQGGNSRWDLIDMVRTCYALRPEGIEWPIMDGKPTFKLEKLSAANGLMHSSAHDALSDVEATIALAKLIKLKQPQLYQHIFELRKKNLAAAMIDLKNRRPLLHVSSRFSSEHGCAALVMPLAKHPTNSNAVIVVDLSAPPDDLIALSAEKIAERVFTKEADLADDETRIPLKAVHLNKCPILLTPKLLTTTITQRLGIDKEKAQRHWHEYLRHDLAKKIADVFQLTVFTSHSDAEQRIYDGFIGDNDKPMMAKVRQASGESLLSMSAQFHDSRLNELWLRYRGRHYPEMLNTQEKKDWLKICEARWQGEGGYLSWDQFKKEMEIIIKESVDDQLARKLAEASDWTQKAIKNIKKLSDGSDEET